MDPPFNSLEEQVEEQFAQMEERGFIGFGGPDDLVERARQNELDIDEDEGDMPAGEIGQDEQVEYEEDVVDQEEIVGFNPNYITCCELVNMDGTKPIPAR
jgi:hypothetical protein